MSETNTADRDALGRAALQLSPGDRESVALELLASLEADASFLHMDAWRIEIDRRLADLAPGTSSLRTWDEVRADLFSPS